MKYIQFSIGRMDINQQTRHQIGHYLLYWSKFGIACSELAFAEVDHLFFTSFERQSLMIGQGPP